MLDCILGTVFEREIGKDGVGGVPGDEVDDRGRVGAEDSFQWDGSGRDDLDLGVVLAACLAPEVSVGLS